MKKSQKISAKQIEDLKTEGNSAFKKKDYGKAIAYYRQGLRLAEQFGTENDGSLPFKMEIGECPEPKEGLMYYQDFTRLKAVLMNNLASCFFF